MGQVCRTCAAERVYNGRTPTELEVAVHCNTPQQCVVRVLQSAYMVNVAVWCRCGTAAVCCRLLKSVATRGSAVRGRYLNWCM